MNLIFIEMHKLLLIHTEILKKPNRLESKDAGCKNFIAL